MWTCLVEKMLSWPQRSVFRFQAFQSWRFACDAWHDFLILFILCQDFLYLDSLCVPLTRLLILLFRLPIFPLSWRLRVPLTQLLIFLPHLPRFPLSWRFASTFDTTFILLHPFPDAAFPLLSCPFLLASFSSLIQVRVVSIPVINKLFATTP